jgi:hypothetical protein
VCCRKSWLAYSCKMLVQLGSILSQLPERSGLRPWQQPLQLDACVLALDQHFGSVQCQQHCWCFL